ncbi:MAG: methionyl-tRNA formyltransferase [Bacteroidota bacterium]
MEKSDLRIVYMGTPDFAVPPLQKLVEEGYQVVGVVTAPDKPAGRGQKLQSSAVKVFAESKNIPVLQPEKLKNPDFIDQLKKLDANLQIVVAFRMLPEIVWSMPGLGTFNLHASLLPQYRGAAPINWAIINGEKKTGVTTFFIQHEIDTGNILLQEAIDIEPDETAGSLHDKLMFLGAKVVLKTVEGIQNQSLEPVHQDELIKEGESLRPAPKIFKDDCKINWNQPVANVYNFIRGLSPYPAAHSVFLDENNEETLVKVFLCTKKELNQKNNASGSISSDGKTFLTVACQNGIISIKSIQQAGKKKMGIQDFLRGIAGRKQFTKAM